MKRAVIFDLIGTLLVANTRRPLSSMYDVLTDHGLSSTLDAFVSAWEGEKSVPSRENHTPFEERLSRTARALDWGMDWNQIARIADDICDNAATILSVDVEVFSLLRDLQRHVKLGIATNYDHPPAIHKMLESTHLAGYFSVVIISGEIGVWKPDPRILRAAIDAMSLQPADCLYVGDSAVDVEVAISAGVDPVLIIREGNLCDPFRNPENDLENEYQNIIRNNGLQVIRRIRDVERFVQMHSEQ
jgi:HAD superfamily hydrolase (TIGR01549 family)